MQERWFNIVDKFRNEKHQVHLLKDEDGTLLCGSRYYALSGEAVAAPTHRRCLQCLRIRNGARRRALRNPSSRPTT